MRLERLFARGLLSMAVFMIPGHALACMDPYLLKQNFSVQGIATNQAGEIVYVEQLLHQSTETGGILNVDYFTPENIPLASKVVDYDCRPTSPNFELIDLQSGKKEGVKWQLNKITSFQDDQETRLTPPRGSTVFDAGFDNSIKINWNRLMAGKPLKVNYLFARDNQFLKLRLQKSAAPAALRNEITEDVVFFKISANNPLFRLFSSSLYVGYSIGNRQLKYFSGPSNLPMMSDLGKVLIRYRDLPASQLNGGMESPVISQSAGNRPVAGDPSDSS